MSGIPPTVRPPSPDDLREVAATFSMELTDEELDDYVQLAERAVAVYERLEELDEPTPPRVEADRTLGYRPDGDEDPHNAFVTRCTVRAREGGGPLDGWRVAVKDNVAVAGVELTCGSKVLSGYVPMADATVVRRIVGAGGTVVGKTNMEDMAVSGGGELSASGPVRNPRNPDYLAGGSSGGSAVAVVTGDADAAIGTDQAGSVRIPAAVCGCVGFKPTYGLVPYTGIVGLGHTFDHAGPLASSVDDCARLLDVIAGPDPLDPRQGPTTTSDDGGDGAHESAVSSVPGDVTVGVLAEGFGHDDSDPAVDDAVREALDGLPGQWTLREVSVPEHDDGMAIWIGVATEENTALVRDEGVGHFVGGYYDTQFADAFGRARRTGADDFPPTLKVRLLLGGYLSEQYRGRYHAMAQNLRRPLRAAYDEALAGVDVLAMPTVPKTAHEVVEEASRKEVVRRGRDMGANTAPFNMTGHPAVTVPCGTVDGLPVGLMLVGEQSGDAALLSVASALEGHVSPYR